MPLADTPMCKIIVLQFQYLSSKYLKIIKNITVNFIHGDETIYSIYSISIPPPEISGIALTVVEGVDDTFSLDSSMLDTFSLDVSVLAFSLFAS